MMFRSNIHNEQMVKRILNHFNIYNCKPASTKVSAGFDLSSDESKRVRNEKQYRQLVGARMHLCNTVRPDICFSMSYLARFMHAPTERLWKAEKHVHKHLQGLERWEFSLEKREMR